MLISARDARLLAKDTSLDPDEPQTKIRGDIRGARTRPTRTFAPGERIGSLEVHAAPGHTPGQVAFLDTRDGTLYCADAFTTVGGVATTAKPSFPFPLAALATWHRPTALATAQALRALDPQRLAPGHGKVVETPGRRDGPGDRPRGVAVARRGLDRARVVDAAVAIADADGLDAVTLARVAAALGVRSPSLYNHVAGRDGLVNGVAVRATRELGTALRRAATGRSGAEAVAAVAAAQRAYARAHPGRYAATVTAPAPGDAEHEAAAADAVDVLTSVFGGMGLADDELIHAVRALRSAVHGFVALEAAGGFGLAVDRDASFDRLVGALATGIA